MCGGHFVRGLVPLIITPAEQTAPVQNTRGFVSQTMCPTCGMAITPEFSWCPKCGSALKSHACAYCGQTINPGDKTCTFCGAPAHKSTVS
jgi:primosomal protein N'